MSRLWMILAVVALLALCGCPKPKAEKTDISITNTGDTAPETQTATEESTPAEV
jgi:hypothetical protein